MVKKGERRNKTLMRARLNKREQSPFRTTWHLGKQQPTNLHTSSWLGSLFKPTTVETSAGKRSAIPNEWNSPWDNVLRSPQGFRFNEAGGRELFNRHLMYKRTPDAFYQETNPSDMESFNSNEQKYADRLWFV